MDMKMNAEEISAGTSPIWDVKVRKGIVPIITGDTEDLQTATLAAFIQTHTIPLLPDAGVPWQNFLTGNISFGELDGYIRNAMIKTGKSEYYPQYDLNGNKLTMTIGKIRVEANV
jgi:hypothetical protein